MRGSFVKILTVFRIVHMILLNEIDLVIVRNKDYSKGQSIQNIPFLERRLIHNYLNN